MTWNCAILHPICWLSAACWADNRKVTQITFKPDWDRDGKAAPFKRNDALLSEVPQAVIVFPGTGITDNLADKAKKLGIRILDHRKETRLSASPSILYVGSWRRG